MGAACTGSCKGNAEHDAEVNAEIVAVVPCLGKDDTCDINGRAGAATGAPFFEKDKHNESLATASTQSDAGSSTMSSPPPGPQTLTELDLLKATQSCPACAAASEWQSPNNDSLRWADGASYTGSLRDGKMNGYGKWTSADERTTYTGEWLDDRWHGKGELVSEVGTYNGQFRKGSFDGRGVMHWTNNRYYEGEWKQGKRHGYGLNMDKMGQQRVGYWKQNRYVGLEDPACFSFGGRWGWDC